MKFPFTVVIYCLFISYASAQGADSLNVNPKDTLTVAETDSLITGNRTAKSDVDTVIYSAASDSLIFYVMNKYWKNIWHFIKA